MADLSVLPGLQQVIQCGYNSVRGNFAGEPVFALTFTSGRTVDYGPYGESKTYLVPDGVGINLATSVFESSTCEVLETTSDYDSYFSASMSGSMSYMSYSASVSSSLAFRGSLFQKTSTTYAVNFGGNKVYAAQRNLLGSLDSSFASALGALPLDPSTPSGREAYFAFFDLYGTHYFADGTFGAYYTMQTEIEETLYEESSEQDITAAVDAAYNSATSSGKMSVSVQSTNSSFLQENSSSFAFKFFTNGGDGSAGSEDIATFNKSAYYNPIVLLDLTGFTPATVKPLSDLIAQGSEHDARVDAFTNALHDYIDLACDAEGLIASPRAMNAAEVYTATNDGFVLGYIQRGVDSSGNQTDGDRAYLTCAMDIVNSSSDTPKTIRGAASMHYDSRDDSRIWCSSFATPVRKGDRWQATYKITKKSPTAAVTFVPLTLPDDVAFGSWQTLSPATYTMTQPGFVVGIVDCYNSSGNDTRGYLQAMLQLQPDTPLQIGTATSAHYDPDSDDYVQTNSFCMPVPAGHTFSLLSVASKGTPSINAYWLPLTATSCEVQSVQTSSVNVVHTADTDGFLLLFLNCGKDGSRGRVIAYTSDDDSLLADATTRSQLVPKAETSAHFDKDDDRWVPFQSVLVPIGKGLSFYADYAAVDGSPSVTAYWIPIVPKEPE